MGRLLLAVVAAFPFLMALGTSWAAERRAEWVIRLSSYAALALVVMATLAAIDVTIVTPLGRSLVLSPLAQLGIQLLALAMLGLGLSLSGEDRQAAGRWLPLAWLSCGGLVLSLLITSLTLAAVTYVAAGLLWALGPPKPIRQSPTGPGLRYAGLLALALAPLVTALRLAEIGLPVTGVEPLARALAAPGIALLLSIVPLHAWTVTLATGSPRVMVIGVLSLVQTAGLVLLIRVFGTYPWLMATQRSFLLASGALSAVIGGWMALVAEERDPDDWLAYAVIANTGFVIMGLATQSMRAAAGISVMLFARVLALVTIALALRAPARLAQLARAAGTLTLAGSPGFAGFPSLWLLLLALQLQAPAMMSLAAIVGSGLLFATAVRRWRSTVQADAPAEADAVDARWPVVVLIILLIGLALVPQIASAVFGRALSGPFLINQ